jgi:hypothetical protein
LTSGLTQLPKVGGLLNQQIPRRAFLQALLATTALSLSRCAGLSSNAEAATVTSKADIHKELLVYAASQTIPPSGAAEAAGVLANAYELAVKQHASGATIDSMASSPSVMSNPATIGALADLANSGADSDLFFDSEAWAKRIGLGAQSAAAVASEILPGYGWAIDLAAVWVEPTLNYLATPDLNLAVNPFPPTPASRADLLTQMAMVRALSAADNNSDMQLALNLPNVKGKVHIDYSSSDDALVNQLPDTWKDAATRAAGASQTDLSNPAFVSAIQSIIQQNLTTSFDALGDKLDTLKSAMQAQQNAAQQAQTRQQQRQQISQTDSEMVGTIAIAGFIASRVFGDSAATRKIFDGGNAVRQIYNSIAQYAVGDIGVLALSGGTLSAASALIGLFGGGSDPVLDALQRITQQLNDIRNELTVVEQKEDQILRAVAQVYEAIKTSQAAAQANSDQLKNLISITLDQANRNSRDQSLNNLLGNARAIKGMLLEAQRDESWRARYKDRLSAIATYAAVETASSYYTGSPDQSGNIATIVNAQPRADLFFGLIPSLCAAAGIPFVSQFSAPVGTSAVPNPIWWSFGSRIYLQLRSAAIDVTVEAERDDLGTLWTQGLRVREAAQFISSPTGLSALTTIYRQYAGIETDHPRPSDQETVLKRIDQIVASFLNDQHVAPNYSFTQISRNSQDFAYLNPAPTADAVKWYSVANDPLQFALDNGLLRADQVRHMPELREGWHPRPYFPGVVVRGPIDWFKLTIIKGDKNGQELISGVRMVNYDDGHGHHYRFFGPNEHQWFFDANNPGVDFQIVLAEAQKLVRLERDWPLITGSLPAKIQDDLTIGQANDPYGPFLWTASVARLAATIAKWRRTPDNLNPDSLDTPDSDRARAARLENVSIPVTVDDYKSLVTNILSKAPDPKDITAQFAWAPFIHGQFAAALNQASDICDAAAADLAPEQGIPEIDEALKMLAAYMKIRSIPTPIPPPPALLGPRPLAQNVHRTREVHHFLTRMTTTPR